MKDNIIEAISAGEPQGWQDIVTRCQDLLAGKCNAPMPANGDARAVEGIMLGAWLSQRRMMPLANAYGDVAVMDRCKQAHTAGISLIAFHHAAQEMVLACSEEREIVLLERLREEQEVNAPCIKSDELDALLTHFHPKLPSNSKDKICGAIRKPASTLECVS